ncbi:MAG: hypothetical protein LBD48_01870 [Treponema sp.]|nr:hypothetical protein [Treponema sp.]
MSSQASGTVQKKWYERIPHTYVILFCMIVIAAILTWILPAGEFTRKAVGNVARPQVIPGSYVQVEQSGVGGWSLLKSIPVGLNAASGIIFMIMISTAAFGVIRETGALDNSIGAALEVVKKAKIPGAVTIWAVTFLFSLLGVLVGPEMHLPFIVIAISIALGLGYDVMVGLGMVIGGGYTGFAFGPLNAAVLGSAHAIMGLQTFSGQGLRWILWFCATVVCAAFTSFYAGRIIKHPEKSLTKDVDISEFKLTTGVSGGTYKVTGRHKLVLLVLTAIFAFIIIGAAKWGWYLTEMATVFLAGGVVAGLLYGYKIRRVIDLYIKGAASAAGVALLVGIARGIQVVLEQGKIMDTIINALSAPLQNFGAVFGGIFISIVTAAVHFFIPSGSGTVFSVMPILGPLGEMIGVSAQTAVLAVQIGATVPNFLFPTVGVMMAMLGISKVPIDKWYRFAIKLTLLLFIVSWVFIFIALKTGY